ncbi:MAG TPA: oxidoreductase, partial [Chitinophagaceae bacterium]
AEVEKWGCEPKEIFGLLHTETGGKVIKERYPSRKGDYGFYYQNLYKTIRENAPLREKPEHGYNTIRLIELAAEVTIKKCQLNAQI